MTGYQNDPDAKPREDAVLVKVRVEAGVQALQTSTTTKGSKENGPQAEITLQHDLQWKVVKDNGIDGEGIRHIEVEVSPIRAESDGQPTGGGAAGSATERTDNQPS